MRNDLLSDFSSGEKMNFPFPAFTIGHRGMIEQHGRHFDAGINFTNQVQLTQEANEVEEDCMDVSREI